MTGPRYRIGIDIGGTFTDLAVVDPASGTSRVFKALSTPSDPLQGILEAVGVACEALGCSARELIGSCSRVVHGTTIGTNAVIQRDGPRMGLLATRGFRDVSEFMKGGRPDTFNLHLERPRPLVPRHRRLGVGGRIDLRGREVEALDEADVRAAARGFDAEGVEAVAVAFLWSQLNPAHERRTREILAAELPGVPVVISSDILPQIREWDRTSATILSAYALPALSGYLSGLKAFLHGNGLGRELLVIQCDGGCAPAERVLRRAARSLGSGPAAAPAAAVHAVSEFRSARDIDILSADMGGTSFDVCLIRKGRPSLTRHHEIEGMPIGFMAADIVSIGAGGGSIAWIDPGGALQVGPRSAGSTPGPACYGRGGEEPTVTDCFVVLGLVDPDAFAGGRMTLDASAAAGAIGERVARPLALSVVEAAHAILRIADFKMVRALSTVSVERGVDPRRLVLVGGGGAGGVVMGRLAEEAGIARVVLPRVAGGYSAFGMTVVDLVFDYVRAMPCDSSTVDTEAVARVFSELEARAIEDMRAAGVEPGEVTFQRFCDASYRGQAHEVIVPLEPSDGADAAALRAPFDREHRRIYGFDMPGDRVVFYHWRLNAAAATEPPRRGGPRTAESGAARGPARSRPVHFEAGGEALRVPVHDGPELVRGDVVPGPAVIREPTTSVTVFPGHGVLVGDMAYDYRVDGEAAARGGG